LVRRALLRATAPHLSIIGHITEYELRATLDHTAMANGFANRFMFCCVRRAQFLPFGGSLDQEEINALGRKLGDAHKRTFGVERVQMDPAARDLWAAEYRALSEGLPGMLGAVTARAEAQTVRLAMLYALLDGVGELPHLQAGLALWRYCEASARRIFGDSVGDPMADDILRALRVQKGGLTRTEINGLFGRNAPAGRIGSALGLLLKLGKVSCTRKSSGSRPQESWLAVQSTFFVVGLFS
jgi:hypothetical protein